MTIPTSITESSYSAAAAKRALTMIHAEESDTGAELQGALLECLEDLVTLARVLWADEAGCLGDPAEFNPKSPDELIRLALEVDARRERLDERAAR